MRTLSKISVTALALFLFAALLPRQGMAGPFLILWVITVWPVAWVPQYIHPALKTRQERRVYKAFAVIVMACTWATMVSVDHWFGNWAAWWWLATEAFFIGLIVHAVRLRIRIKAMNHPKQFNEDHPDWLTHLRGTN